MIFLFLSSCASLDVQHPPLQGKNETLFLHVPAGEYIIGSNDPSLPLDEEPQFSIFIDGFYLQQFEVTNQQYAEFLNQSGFSFDIAALYIGLRGSSVRPSELAYTGNRFRASFGYEKHPVATVSYRGAKAYCEWIGGRLPTEFEWEAAASDYRDLDWEEPEKQAQINQVWIVGSRMPIVAVGSFSPSQLGFYDLIGNVFELTSSKYEPYPASDKAILTDSKKRMVLRGGDWATPLDELRITTRLGIRAKSRGLFEGGVGFRCAKDMQ